MLRDALVRLNADAPQQREYLRQLGVEECADELALEFDSVYRLLGECLGRREITEAQVSSVIALNEYLREMGGEENADLWTPEALESSEKWSRVRELAEEALFSFGMIDGYAR